jgi:hypothetical protein
MSRQETLTPRERIAAVFRGEAPDRIVWQPRIFFWYEVNRAAGTLPRLYEHASIMDLFDDLSASPRSYHFFNSCVRSVWRGDVDVKVTDDAQYVKTTYTTPKGKLSQVEGKTSHGQAKIAVEYAVKSVHDFEILTYVLEHEDFLFDQEEYSRIAEVLGERTVSSVNVPWLPLQRLTVEYMGLQNTILALWKHRSDVESLLSAMEENNDRRFNLLRRTPVEIINFGDNIDQDLISPSMFERYALPYYRSRTTEFHEAGKICTSHWDGKFHSLLPFVRRTGLDALECVAPRPMGDVDLQELHCALGDMVLMDGIPATYFLPYVSPDSLKDYAIKVLGTFSPRLILGIGDMLPADGEIERVRMISNIVQDYVV